MVQMDHQPAHLHGARVPGCCTRAVDALRAQPNAVDVAPGDRHWPTFRRLCIAAGAKGNLVADAFHATLAIEVGAELITTGRGFSRFPGLRWRHPLEGPV